MARPVSQLKDLLLSQLGSADEMVKHQQQQLNEDNAKIKELTSSLALMKETLHTETQKLENKNAELLQHTRRLEELEAERNKLAKRIKQLEEKRDNLKRCKENAQDQQVLQQGGKKLNLYRDLTRIHWDYEASKHSIKGYVSNKKDYIHHFCYDNQQITPEITDALWHEIYLSTGKTKIEDETLQSNMPTNENIAPN
ncbi:hypothetical protein DMN91_009298 [Ooceraea biroi]|uniref:Kinetochore protein Spc24 n=1 Tax=Ooceraea biroi TaxID=2015173 RepID=A0A026WS04_OOCBI|nr:uncharacterized protein LOC105276168 [Ooceraea biroi]XP_011331866.1 uncharacterized protein LOC105276168 [Ooceraea biroi]EZA58723.1 hypothetical protein X777_14892 [Ooceraea biroi]RLU18940.1 hypothetical protein DMN91_009298 [Ooceraea biroi]